MEENLFMTDSSDFDLYIQDLLSGKTPSEAIIAKICAKAKEVLVKEPNVISLKAPITICGNVSGQFEDLLEIFRLIGKPPEMNFVFLGNFFHRGENGVETFSLLLALKIRYKDKVTLLRGMGEEERNSMQYGLYQTCERKFGNTNVWKLFTELFNYFPFSAVVDDTFYCTPGGLVPIVSRIDQMQELDRFGDSQHPDNPVMNMRWSEPGDNEDWEITSQSYGYCFPKIASKMFNHVNNFKMICRMNRLEMEGYSYTHDRIVLSLCSSPHYVNRCKNLGAIVKVDEDLEMKILQFKTVRKIVEEKTTTETFGDFSFQNPHKS